VSIAASLDRQCGRSRNGARRGPEGVQVPVDIAAEQLAVDPISGEIV
jgi:hypothetical protein